MSSYGLCPTMLKPTAVTAGSKTLIDQTWCNTSVATSTDGILSDISDHFLFYAQVTELSDFLGNDDSFVTIKCRMKISE